MDGEVERVDGGVGGAGVLGVGVGVAERQSLARLWPAPPLRSSDPAGVVEDPGSERPQPGPGLEDGAGPGKDWARVGAGVFEVDGCAARGGTQERARESERVVDEILFNGWREMDLDLDARPSMVVPGRRPRCDEAVVR